MLHAQHTYYLNNADGSDNNSGISPGKAWKTIDKINHVILNRGDKVLLKAGQTFEGNISLDSMDNGNAQYAINISTYGKGRAIIKAGTATGIFADNISYINISNLYIVGDGVERNEGSGIHFFSDRTDHSCKRIRIDNCIVEGFHEYGIVFGCAEDEAVKGYDDVRITKCSVLLNGEAGIASYGGQTSFHHTNFYVGNCRAFLNKGIVEKTESHSGNGIVMSGVENLLIENCEAYDNGENNRCTAGGPVGIWMWLCKNGVIQHCESHHNHAGLTKDGGGFDIDGGSSNCILQYNYSHDNEGAGFLLAEYGAVLPFTDNTIRFNISENDGRKNSYGCISIWGADSAHCVNNSYIYNNTIYLTDSNIVDGMPAAVTLFENNFKHVLITNNIFCASKETRILNADAVFDTSAIYFLANNYGGTNWKTTDPSQEIYNGIKKDDFIIPVFSSGLKGPEKFHLKNAAAFENKGIDLKKVFGIDTGDRDFFGKRIKQNSHFLGAALQ